MAAQDQLVLCLLPSIRLRVQCLQVAMLHGKRQLPGMQPTRTRIRTTDYLRPIRQLKGA